MDAMPSASPMASSVFVAAPYNGYPVMSGVMSQVPSYPNSQPPVHVIPGNPPGLMPAVTVLPAPKILKEGKVLGFIISGSISMAAKTPRSSSCLLGASVGLNIFSAICSAVRIILLITELSLTRTYSDLSYYPPHSSWDMNTGMAVSGMLLIFCILEFCVACTSSHFGCQVVCCQYSQLDPVFPSMYAANPVAMPPPPNPTPGYTSGVQDYR
ncbi:membrane-spanning 4-domains subfamily A member 8-like isoform X2 [Dipodomys merriami]|uniref:membrane-spanning 4-domains subfamily A member 8-like isoform X2 n=1 Tax=Dipodomys merriami TaxID=94247 RepID=UPI003855BD4A